MRLSELVTVYESTRFKNKYLVLNPKVPSWIVTNQDGLCVLKILDSILGDISLFSIDNECLKNNDILIKNIKFIEQIYKKGLFKTNSISQFHKPFFLRNLYLNMTSKCNLNCIYCFAESRQEDRKDNLSFDDYKAFLNEAYSISKQKLNIAFTGGEPLLNPLTLELARYAKEKGFICKLMTNGTLINKNNIDCIKSCFDEVRISMDGSTESIHDYYRGKGAYRKTVAGINLLEERGINYKLAMVVTKKNIEDVLVMKKKWGNRLIFQPYFPFSKNESILSSLAISGEEYYSVLCRDSDISPFSDIASVIEKSKKNESIYKCAIGDGELSLSSNGDVYPCQLLHFPEFLLGNIKKTSLVKIYNSSLNEKFKYHTCNCIEKCNECNFKLLCGGACQARHFAETGSIDKAGDFCEYEKNAIVDGLIASSFP